MQHAPFLFFLRNNSSNEVEGAFEWKVGIKTCAHNGIKKEWKKNKEKNDLSGGHDVSKQKEHFFG